MLRVIGAETMRTETGPGWTRIILADAESLGEEVMVAEQWDFSPSAVGPEQVHQGVDQLLYVIRGSGVAVVNGDGLELGPESMLWLEPGERYRLQAGDHGMQILQGYVSGAGP